MSRSGDLLDVTVGLGPGLPMWPGSTGLAVRKVRDLTRGDAFNASHLECDVHLGTHVDAPSHFLADGATVGELELGVLLGPAWVARFEGRESLDADVLRAAGIPRGTRRLLLQTGNSELWRGASGFVSDYVALTPDAARWLVGRGIELVGIDYLSIQRFADPPDVHTILLGAGVVVVEGLDLSGVRPGAWELICLPLKLLGAEAAPARVLLRREVEE